MKNTMHVLEIELRRSKNMEMGFYFNDTMLHAVISGLSIVYDEVFIWSVGNHLAVWVVGNNSEFLLRAFMHHRNQYKRMKLATDAKAKELMCSIADGKTWAFYSMTQKLDALLCGSESSKELGCVKSILHPLISDSISSLNANPIISASQNSWSRKSTQKTKSEKNVPQTSVKSANLFYRFCIN